MRHADTTAVITGGTQGLGRAIAERLIAEGCRQILIASRSDGAAAACDLSATGAEVAWVRCDMAQPGDVADMIAAGVARMGRVTALVNAAAATDRGGLLDTTPDLWDRIFAVNVRGPFLAMQAFANAAIAAGHAGTCVNILSMSAHGGQSFLAPYSASKAALANVTRNAGQAMRRQGLRFNGINAGWMDTPGEDATQRRYHGADADWLARAEAAAPMGSLVKPQHVAALAAYLLSAESGVMTGAIVDFDQHVHGAGD